MTFQGKTLTDDMTLTLCVNDYRYTGLKNEGIISGEKEWESSASVRDMLVAYLAERPPGARGGPQLEDHRRGSPEGQPGPGHPN